jgi:hypothetical protein
VTVENRIARARLFFSADKLTTPAHEALDLLGHLLSAPERDGDAGDRAPCRQLRIPESTGLSTGIEQGD